MPASGPAPNPHWLPFTWVAPKYTSTSKVSLAKSISITVVDILLDMDNGIREIIFRDEWCKIDSPVAKVMPGSGLAAVVDTSQDDPRLRVYRQDEHLDVREAYRNPRASDSEWRRGKFSIDIVQWKNIRLIEIR